MSEFDTKAAEWDNNPMHWDRSRAIAEELKKKIPLTKKMNALEFGAGTGILGFLLKEQLQEITLMDNSAEMVNVMNQKIGSSDVKNLKTIFFDLELHDYKAGNFDLIFTQMVLHHVSDIENLIHRFHRLLNPGGYLAIADLYSEEGSFHGDGFTGHNGFDPDELSTILNSIGFRDIIHSKCFSINKQTSGSQTRQFDVFLLTGQK